MTASRLVEVLLSHASDGKVSDLSLEPSEHEVRVRYRHDGVLRTALTFPIEHHAEVTAYLKKMAGLDLRTREPQTGTWFHVRISVFPIGVHERLTLQFSSTVPVDQELRSLGYDAEQLKIFTEEQNGLDKGMLLLTALPGHGKTAAIESLRRFFASDEPIVVDGLRDDSTVEYALHMAVMNRLVLTTIPVDHVHDGYANLRRTAPAYLLSHGLRVGIRQRLVCRLCLHCKDPERLSANIEKQIFQEWKKMPSAYRDREIFDQPLSLWHSRGCARCGNTGYKGRIATLEVFRFTDTIKASLGTKRVSAVLERELPRQRSLLLHQDLLLKALQGIVCGETLAPYYSFA